jgi:methyl-accepting chemotaxis protein
MTALERHRLLAHLVLSGFGAAHVLVIGAVAFALGGPWLLLSGAALACAGLTATVRYLMPHSALTRAAAGMTLMAQVSLLVAAMSGSPWQVDAHMYYFAILALVGFYCDAFAVLAAAGLVAVHHLSLNFLLPDALYPGGGDFIRVLLHAVVVVIESVGLVFMGEVIRRAFVASDAALDRAAEARAAAEAATQEAERLRGAEHASAGAREAQQAATLAEQSRMADVIGAELARLAEGDLTARVGGALSGAYLRLKDDLNGAMARLEAALRDVRQSTRGMRSELSAVDEIAGGLARRAETQADQLDSIAASVREMVDLVARAAAGAGRAREMASAADEDANTNSVVVRRAIEAMGAITESANKIGGIIGVIDEIAFQTNLLALNAGVEAARAGDSGRGFAVVAQEVRALARRSAQAAKEIKDLISSSVATVESGAELVRNTGETLERIVGRVSEINGVVGDIAASASEQSGRISAIDGAVRELEQTTRDTVAMSERASAASAALGQEGQTLEKLIGQFRVKESAPARRPRAA